MNHPGIRQFLKCLLPKRGLTSHKTALSPFLFMWISQPSWLTLEEEIARQLRRRWNLRLVRRPFRFWFPKCICPKVYFPKQIDKCTWLTHLLSFASLFTSGVLPNYPVDEIYDRSNCQLAFKEGRVAKGEKEGIASKIPAEIPPST